MKNARLVAMNALTRFVLGSAEAPNVNTVAANFAEPANKTVAAFQEKTVQHGLNQNLTLRGHD